MENILSDLERDTLLTILNKIASKSIDNKVLVFNTVHCTIQFQYPIDGDKLNQLAKEYANINQTDYGTHTDWSELYEGFVAGYKKAMEE